MTDSNQHFPGNIICRSWVSESDSSQLATYFRLGDDDVKTKAKHIPETALKEYLATIPQFYQHRSTIFTDLGKSNGFFKDR